jgi:hypothetical protein
MPVQTFTTLDEVPENQREAVIETKAGTFLLVVEEDAAALKGALDEERMKREAAEKLATKTANALRKAEAEAKAKASGLSDEQIANIRADLRREIESEYEPVKAKAADADALAAENRALLLDNKVKATMAAKGVRADRIEALFKVAGDRFDLTADKSPMLRDKPGIAIDAYIAETLKAEYPEFFEGTKATGSGAPGSSGVPLTPVGGADLSPIDRITLARQQGKAA